MKLHYALIFVLLASLMIISTGSCLADPPQFLTEIGKQVNDEFTRLDAELRQASQTLAVTGLTGEQTREALSQLCNKFDYAVDCSTIDLKGRMVTLEPAAYRKFEGKDISDQEQVRRILQTGKPVMSNVFMAVEGFSAVDVEYPITTQTGRRRGSVSILFDPEKMLGPIIKARSKQLTGNIWVLDESGLLIYNTEKNRSGLNLFTSEPYRSCRDLISLGHLMVSKPQGEGFYSIRQSESADGKVLKNKVIWQTVSLYGNFWRLVLVSTNSFH